jgi:hypothetical protein
MALSISDRQIKPLMKTLTNAIAVMGRCKKGAKGFNANVNNPITNMIKNFGYCQTFLKKSFINSIINYQPLIMNDLLEV